MPHIVYSSGDRGLEIDEYGLLPGCLPYLDHLGNTWGPCGDPCQVPASTSPQRMMVACRDLSGGMGESDRKDKADPDRKMICDGFGSPAEASGRSQ